MNEQRRPPLAPGAQPVVGHTLSVLREPLTALQRWGQSERDLIRLRIASRTFYLVTTPAAIEQVLVTDADQYRKADIVRERLGRLQGGSLVLLEGTQWHDRRELLQSGFGRQQVEKTALLTTEAATEMVEGWPTDRPVELRTAAQNLVLSVLGRALFGLDLRDEQTPIHEAADDVLARMDLRSPSAYLPDWAPTPTNYRFRRAISTLHDRLDAVVAAASSDGQHTSGSSANLFSIMLAAGLPKERIRDELIALLFAGYDSTATALSLTLGLLGEHPDAQAELQTELSTVLGSDTPTVADLTAMPVLDAIVREGVRLYPPQYLLFRQSTEPVQLCGYRIEPETTVVLPPWVVQRDARFWSAPTAFRPERWLNGASDRPEFAYFPYGGGPRHCLGAQLATQTIKLVLAVVCQHCRLELDGTVSVRAGPTLMPDELPVRVVRA